jgi:predicted nucleic acid-binding protein
MGWRAGRVCVGREPSGERGLTAFLVDTSFLISLADPARTHHRAAAGYFREALRHGAPLYLSAIAASEFQVKQAVTDLPLRNFIVLPFNFDHAMTAGLLMRQLERDAGDRRDVVKDDVKLIAQAVCESVSHVLTEDRHTLAKYVRRFSDAGLSAIKVVLLADGFDVAWFNDGQHGIPGA